MSYTNNLLRQLAVLAIAAVLLMAAGLSLPSPAPAASPTFTFSGAGYGHGIGLSQYGAKGWAEQGKAGTWIASYYYPGTTIGNAPTTPTLWVNLDANANYRTSSSGYNGGYTRSIWNIRPGFTGGKFKVTGLKNGATASSTSSYADGIYGIVPFQKDGSYVGVTVKKKNTDGSYSSVTSFVGDILVEPDFAANQWLIQITDASGPFNHTYVRYRGRMQFKVNSSGKIKLLNKLAMSDYLKGVIPRESPASWPSAALQAQAIVARSYAYTSGGDLYCTTWSQVYNGHSRGDRNAPTAHEDDRTNAAVDITNNKYVLYGGKVIKTFFHSSSGGHTANIEDVWIGTGEPSTSYPYRKGVDDPYCAGPYDPWTDPPTFSALALASKLAGLVNDEPAGTGSTVGVKSIAIERAWPSGFARTIDVTWSNGAVSRDISGDSVRSALGLRSTKFFVNGAYTRIYSGSRFDTAVKVSQMAYPTSGVAKAAVVVNGSDDKYADALSASALAGVADGSVLLVQHDSVSSGVLNEIKRLGVAKVYVVGGTASVSDEVLNKVKAVVSNTERVAGNDRYGRDRYGTAAHVAMKIKTHGGDGTHVMIASGENWPDAAVAASVAAGSQRPLLLVRKGVLPLGAARALVDLGATHSAVFGGPNVISDATVSSLLMYTKEAAPEKRFGATGGRYDMAVEAAKWSVSSLGFSLGKAYVSSGETFVDSVTGGVLAGKNKYPMLLTTKAAPAAPTASYVSANRGTITDIVVIGGTGAITEACASTLASYAY